MITATRASLCRCLIPLFVALACAGCSSPGEKHAAEPGATAKKRTQHAREASLSKAEQELRRGIRSYEEAEYEIAARQLQSALDRGLENRTDKANAYKYLAFVACASGRKRACHAEFRKALEADPKFELAAAEAGHPIWGPVFRSVKEEMGGKAKTR